MSPLRGGEGASKGASRLKGGASRREGGGEWKGCEGRGLVMGGFLADTGSQHVPFRNPPLLPKPPPPVTPPPDPPPPDSPKFCSARHNFYSSSLLGVLLGNSCC